MEQDLKISKKSTADLVSDKIKELITNHTWTAGQKIPTEMELSRSFGVNRLTVRIALQRLSALGLLDIRVGDGTYVKQFDLNDQIHELADFYINPETIENVMEYREVIESGCVPAMIRRYTEEELEHFHELCLKFQADLEQYYEEKDPEQARNYFLKTIDTSEEMHASLIGMTHNTLMTYAFSLAKEPMRRHMHHNAARRIKDLDSEQKNIWPGRWLALYEEKKKKNEEECRTLLLQIIRI